MTRRHRLHPARGAVVACALMVCSSGSKSESAAPSLPLGAAATSAGIVQTGTVRGWHDSVGPVEKGQIVLIHHIPSARYLALVLHAVEPVDPRDAGAGPYAYADVT